MRFLNEQVVDQAESLSFEINETLAFPRSTLAKLTFDRIVRNASLASGGSVLCEQLAAPVGAKNPR